MENINNLIESNLKLCYADLKSIEAAKIDILKAVANEIEQVKKLNSNCLEFVPSTKDGLFCTVCDEHKQCHSKLLLTV